jgi:hypothetical protein
VGGDVFTGTPSDRVELSPIVDDRALDVDDCVVLMLVDGPTDAASSVNSAVCVLQHLILSASLSQQNFASLANPSDPHCHTCTPEARKSYAVVLIDVSWLSWHCCGHSGLAQLRSVHVPRAYAVPVSFVAFRAQSPLFRQAERVPQHWVNGASASQGTSVLVSPFGK